jgi:hypothetical protein
MNVECLWTEAALFPEKEYINGILLAVWARSRTSFVLYARIWPLVSGYYLVRVFSRIRPPDLRPDKDSRGCELEAISTVKEAAEKTAS